jgi:hypothetical protein
MEIDGVRYDFNDDTDLTLSVLRKIGSWFPLLRTYSDFRLAYLRGDPDALACVRWIVLKRENKPVQEPQQMADFPLGEFMNSWLAGNYEPCLHCGGIDDGIRRLPGRGWNEKPDESDAVEENPTTGGRSQSRTRGTSTETPTSSELNTSGSSGTSAI